MSGYARERRGVPSDALLGCKYVMWASVASKTRILKYLVFFFIVYLQWMMPIVDKWSSIERKNKKTRNFEMIEILNFRFFFFFFKKKKTGMGPENHIRMNSDFLSDFLIYNLFSITTTVIIIIIITMSRGPQRSIQQYDNDTHYSHHHQDA